MRRKPKVEEVLVGVLLRMDHTEAADAWPLLVALDEAGYDVRPRREWERDRERAAVAEHEASFLRDEAKSIEQWGQRGYAEARDAAKRCSFLYEKAIAHGATPEELSRQPEVKL